MNPESLGFSPHHTFTETYCPGCGNPESSGEHGEGCPQDLERAAYWLGRKWQAPELRLLARAHGIDPNQRKHELALALARKGIRA